MTRAPAGRILITGGNGLLAEAAARLWSEHADIVSIPRADLDVTDADAMRRAFDEHEPEIWFQGAAYTAVDRAETEREQAEAVNHGSIAVLASECATRGVLLVTASTDYVFDGESTRPYTEDDETAPLGHYAQTKLRGEAAAAACEHLIVRVQALYGTGRATLVDRLLDPSAALTIVNDRISQPSFADDVATAISNLIEAGARGIFHVANQGSISWYEFALLTRKAAGLPATNLTPAAAPARPEPARRPRFSALSSAKYEAATQHSMRSVHDALQDFLGRRGTVQ
ncbi:MAG: dTDP-4-dehydrorhamnose reductase [Planctomycetota bacterium]